MLTETFATCLVTSGLLGLSCWAIGILDHLYRLGTVCHSRRRARLYARLDNAFITIGTLFAVAFVAGLYYLVSTQGVR